MIGLWKQPTDLDLLGLFKFPSNQIFLCNNDETSITIISIISEVLSSASDKVKLLPENSSKNCNFDDSGTSLPVFSYRTNPKLHNISVTPRTVKIVIMNRDLSKASGPNCIHCTQNYIFFFWTPWKNGLSKNIALEHDLSCIIGKDDISYSRKYDLTS